MKPLSDVTFCLVDAGLFLPLAHRMAQACKRVLLVNPERRAFPSIKQSCIGDGYEHIEVMEEFWDELPNIDLFGFPDVGNSQLQTYLRSVGKAVWGSAEGDIFETDREFFLETLKEAGLEVPPHVVIEGLDALREHLKDQTDKFIKISKYRGDMETTHWRDWVKDKAWLDWMAVNLGATKNLFRFLVFDAIETELEIGGDTYNVFGQWPDLMLNGIEWKDKSYFAAVTPTTAMPEQIREIMDAFGPRLGENAYCNQWSMEIRIKDDQAYFIDATCRAGMPSSASQQLLWENFPEIVWQGANGILVQPEPTAQFAIECMITSKTGKETWDEVDLPAELVTSARLSNCCLVDGATSFPPDEFHSGELGWLCATGDTPAETLANIKSLADQLPDGLNADVEDLAGVIKEIDTAQEQGIPFTDQPVPEPATVIED